MELPGGAFVMGTDEPYWYQGDGEGPTREITLRPFRTNKYSVTNAQYRSLVDDTGCRTEAERPGWSFVFHKSCPCPTVRAGGVTKR